MFIDHFVTSPKYIKIQMSFPVATVGGASFSRSRAKVTREEYANDQSKLSGGSESQPLLGRVLDRVVIKLGGLLGNPLSTWRFRWPRTKWKATIEVSWNIWLLSPKGSMQGLHRRPGMLVYGHEGPFNAQQWRIWIVDSLSKISNLLRRGLRKWFLT